MLQEREENSNPPAVTVGWGGGHPVGSRTSRAWRVGVDFEVSSSCALGTYIFPSPRQVFTHTQLYLRWESGFHWGHLFGKWDTSSRMVHVWFPPRQALKADWRGEKQLWQKRRKAEKAAITKRGRKSSPRVLRVQTPRSLSPRVFKAQPVPLQCRACDPGAPHFTQPSLSCGFSVGWNPVDWAFCPQWGLFPFLIACPPPFSFIQRVLICC